MYIIILWVIILHYNNKSLLYEPHSTRNRFGYKSCYETHLIILSAELDLVVLSPTTFLFVRRTRNSRPTCSVDLLWRYCPNHVRVFEYLFVCQSTLRDQL